MIHTSRVSEQPTITVPIPFIQYTQSPESGNSNGSYPPSGRGGRWLTSDEPDLSRGDDGGETDPLAEPIETSSSSVDRDVSVILPTYNERETVRDVLETARAELEASGYTPEVLVVDDDSPDGTGEFVERKYSDDERVRAIIRRDDAGLSYELSEFETAWDAAMADGSFPVIRLRSDE